jgi:Ca-activated chloride channel homolog
MNRNARILLGGSLALCGLLSFYAIPSLPEPAALFSQVEKRLQVSPASRRPSPETQYAGMGLTARLSQELRGEVRDAGNGVRMPGVRLVLEPGGLSTQSDASGQFRFGGLRPGSYTLTVTAKGYAAQALSVSLIAGQSPSLQIALQALPRQIEGGPEMPPVDLMLHDVEEIRAEPGIIHAPPAHERSGKAKSQNHGGLQHEDVGLSYVQPSHPAYTIQPQPGQPAHNTDNYDRITERPFLQVMQEPLSTFSIDVDGAAYAQVRRYLDHGQQPPADIVRIEELLNYFRYEYPQPSDGHPFSISTEISSTPWNAETHLVHIGLQGMELSSEDLKPSNLVFLLDVSGSMQGPNKLGLVKTSMLDLIEQLGERDRVAIVVYAGAAGEVLPSTPASRKQEIRDAINRLTAGGSTAGGAGIQLAYAIAQQNLIPEGNNRIILCTDGDFNVGLSSDAEMIRLMEEKRRSGVYMTVCGFGMGNYKDGRLEKIAQHGNGNYYYIDSEKEARKIFVAEMRSTLFTIAEDVKLQVEFNPAYVASYRLIGYENRALAREDFNNDLKDAGELGPGHTVTALYEVQLQPVVLDLEEGGIPVQQLNRLGKNEPETLRYQNQSIHPNALSSGELLTLKLRYKKPGESRSVLLEHPLTASITPAHKSSDNFRWSAAVAAYGLVLRNSQFKGSANMDLVQQLARGAQGRDLEGYRADFIRMIGDTQRVLAGN